MTQLGRLCAVLLAVGMMSPLPAGSIALGRSCTGGSCPAPPPTPTVHHPSQCATRIPCFAWTIAGRFGSRDALGVTREPNTRDYVAPPEGYAVRLNACATQGATHYHWNVPVVADPDYPLPCRFL